MHLAGHGARAWFPAVTIAIIVGVRFINLGFVVIGDNGFNIIHAVVAQFKRVPAENFVKWICFREVMINERQEALSYIRFDILAERWVVPNNVSWTVRSRLLYPVV